MLNDNRRNIYSTLDLLEVVLKDIEIQIKQENPVKALEWSVEGQRALTNLRMQLRPFMRQKQAKGVNLLFEDKVLCSVCEEAVRGWNMGD